MKSTTLIQMTFLLLLVTACSNTTPAKKQYYSPDGQQSHSQESLRGL